MSNAEVKQPQNPLKESTEVLSKRFLLRSELSQA